MQRETAEELALGSAVAFAEGMDGVDLAEVVAGAAREGVGVEAFEMVLGLERGEEGFERRQDELRGWEAEGVGAGGGDFAEVAGPGEDVLEDVTVDKAKVADIEAAGDGLIFKLDYADEGQPRDVRFQFMGIRDAELVAKNAVLVFEMAVKENAGQGL